MRTFGSGPELPLSERWSRTAGRGAELSRWQPHAVSPLSVDCLGVGVPCPSRRFVLSPC